MGGGVTLTSREGGGWREVTLTSREGGGGRGSHSHKQGGQGGGEYKLTEVRHVLSIGHADSSDMKPYIYINYEKGSLSLSLWKGYAWLCITEKSGVSMVCHGLRT